VSSISGYQIIDRIHEGLETVVYRAYSDASHQPVILKVLKSNYPSLQEITRLRHEYDVVQNLNLPGVVRSYSLENYQNGLVLVSEDFGGKSLKEALDKENLDLKKFLNIAIQLASALSQLHAQKIIHKDVKPENIIINIKTGEVKLTDFSISSRLAKESPVLEHSQRLEGTFAYMSPEQTGRMNRSLDYRTDFYSLGVTFYEMLVGYPPFQGSDPLELIHCHIAKQPIPPHKIQSNIPLVVSDLIMKLMAKTAEERYASALGIKADLEKCLAQLEATGSISSFSLGEQDLKELFLIPEKIYGREKEVSHLMDAFERVSFGSREMILVSGYSGVGKSSLVNEVHKPIVATKGYFISGKFDQLKRNIPYASLIQAFQELIKQLLIETPEKIATWRDKILEALEDNGKVISDVIPEIELIIGKQPNVVSLSPTESQNRFNQVFQDFIQVFTQKEHPLVIFLDDLQWADSASLKLLQLLMTTSDSHYLLLIGAYRDNEVSPTHPLMLTLKNIAATGATLNNIILKPLEFSHVSQLIHDTLHAKTEIQQERLKPLKELVYHITQGNPFFLIQFLKSLYEDKLLTYGENQWEWDLKQIQEVSLTELSIIELVAKNIHKLSEETQETLKLAACI